MILVLTGGADIQDLPEESRQVCDETLLLSLVEEAG